MKQIGLLIGRRGSIAGAKCSRQAIRMIQCSSLTRVILPNGQFAWSKIARRELTLRPLTETARDALAWFKSQPQDRQSKMKAGLTRGREAEVLAAWHNQQK